MLFSPEVVIAFRYLIPSQDFRAFKRKLSGLIDKTTKKLQRLEREELLECMGFPPNWKDITRYRLK